MQWYQSGPSQGEWIEQQRQQVPGKHPDWLILLSSQNKAKQKIDNVPSPDVSLHPMMFEIHINSTRVLPEIVVEVLVHTPLSFVSKHYTPTRAIQFKRCACSAQETQASKQHQSLKVFWRNQRWYPCCFLACFSTFWKQYYITAIAWSSTASSRPQDMFF